ncbi:unnamed protein product [Protopolystoma xenopodis]|uniref:Uncharacterized protein n=1 Tax=Protopolystoma xenopodis TaxID=117903 RepID=A0A448W9U8_9PLAT|nr:unnamed protein product [Protopolystoma xenopodis]
MQRQRDCLPVSRTTNTTNSTFIFGRSANLPAAEGPTAGDLCLHDGQSTDRHYLRPATGAFDSSCRWHLRRISARLSRFLTASATAAVDTTLPQTQAPQVADSSNDRRSETADLACLENGHIGLSGPEGV